jgi:hypothetical protein
METKRVWCIIDTTTPQLHGMAGVAIRKLYKSRGLGAYTLGTDIHTQRAEWCTEAGADAALERLRKINPTGAACLTVVARDIS